MIRRWRPSDAKESYAVYVDAVHHGTGAHYSDVQRNAWVPSDSMEDDWPRRLSDATTWVAADDRGLCGLIAFRSDGYLDLFFVSPRARGTGIAGALYEALASEASALGIGSLTCHASDYLKPFLEKRGWQVRAEEHVERNGVTLRRWDMALNQAAASQRS